MTMTPSWADRLRIERALWILDASLASYLPWRLRTAKLREVRANLYAATADVGSGEAAFRHGILAVSAHPAGTFRWPGIPYFSNYATAFSRGRQWLRYRLPEHAVLLQHRPQFLGVSVVVTP
jgi:hypothetical protein